MAAVFEFGNHHDGFGFAAAADREGALQRPALDSYREIHGMDYTRPQRGPASATKLEGSTGFREVACSRGHTRALIEQPERLVFLHGRRQPSGVIRPGDDFEAPVGVLGKRRATFDPVAAIHVANAEILVNDRMVNMAADHAVDATPPRFFR